MFFMKKNSTLLFAVFITAITGAFAQESLQLHNGHFQMQSDEFDQVGTQTIESVRAKSPQLKVNSNQNENGLILASDFKYNAYDQLVEKSTYKFDNIGRMIEKITYIINDYSMIWMSGREQWICSYLLKRTYDPADNRYIGASLIEYEYKYLDLSTGILRGSSKWKQTISEFAGFTSTFESYGWSTTTNDWIGNSKNESTYSLVGDILSEEGIEYSWNDTTKVWKKPTTTKYSYKYKKAGASWIITEYKEYELVNGSYSVTYEDIREPNSLALDIYSSIVKATSNGQLVNNSKTLKTFNIYNQIKQSETYNWYNNQWMLTQKDTYDYTTPDSIRTQTTYRTSGYYAVWGYTLPTLCSGQTLYPYRKTVSKFHPKSKTTELSYAYTWTNCAWIPSGTKSTYTYDTTGTLRLSYIQCSTTTSTDWTGCKLYSYYYNSKGKQTLYKYTTDGNLYNTKIETEFISDTIIKKAVYSKTTDINGDGVIADNEWISDGYRVYKYSLDNNSDSLHIDMNNLSSVELYDFITLKKLKVSGPLSCEELNEINRLSSDSLEVLDLSDAILKGDSLTEECMGDTELQILILPKSLKVIDEDAIQSDLYEEKYLKTLVVYPSIQVIHPYGILIGKLENVTIPSKYFKNLFEMDNETSIQGIKDVYKTSLKSATFNDLNGKIPDAICYNMPYLQRVTIEDGVTEIGNNAFKSCGMLREVNFPASSLRKIGYNAFWGCNELTSLTLPEGLNTIDYSAFWGCSGVNSITMPSSLTNIAQNAFWGCSAVSSMKVAAQTPPLLGINALQGIPREANVIVPETGIYAYKAAPQWKEFFNINTDVRNTQLQGILLTSANGQLTLQNLPVNVPVNVYCITGTKITSVITTNKNEILQLTKGAYVIQIGNQHFKTLVK